MLEALREAKIANDITIATDGEEALAVLGGTDGREKLPPPDLILLDLNLPGMDGHEVLAAIKAHLRLRTIPVVVLTTSTAEADILASYNLKASAYVTKPVDLPQFLDVVQAIEGFWLEVVRFPSAE